MRSIGPVAVFLIAVGGWSSRGVGDAAPPEILDPGPYVNAVRLPDGSIKRWRANGGYIKSQVSFDNGTTWSAEFNDFPTPGGTNPLPLLDADGELHVFRFLADDQTNGQPRQPNINFFLDIWHTQSSNGRTTWSTLEMIHHGYTGSMMKAIQTSSGRIVVPFADWIPGGKTTDPYGRNYTTAIYSDDNGASWGRSPSQLYSPVPPNYNGAGEGAVEPTIVELNDGRLWMLMRTQAGYLYESYSTDEGATWSDAAPSLFYSSTGPPNMVRMDDGRLVLFWNNAAMPERHNGAIWYAGRDVLHAAISSDDGKTWSGFREVYLDPYRNENPILGDTGTAYPFPALTHDGRILVITGQTQARAMLRIDPDWLEETSQSDDFTGPDPLAGWSVFKPFGPVVSVKRNREQGPQVIDDPDPAVDKPVLHVRRPNENDPDGAMWNFPMARKGITTVRLKLQEGFGGGAIALTDRFFNPTDPQGDEQAIFYLPIATDGSLPGGAQLDPGQWYDLNLEWDLATHEARVMLDGQLAAVLDQLNQARPGPSYLRLRSTASAIDLAGYLVDAVSQVGLPTGPVRESTRMSVTEAVAALDGSAGWTTLRFDDYVPNTNATPQNPSGNGQIQSFSGTFMGFLTPTGSAAPVGILISNSEGDVIFTDATSAQVTSDLLGARNGHTLTITFVDPSDPTRKAAVAGVAWRFGSTLADSVEVTLLDAEGNKLPDYMFRGLDAASAGAAVGFIALEDLHQAPVIHQIILRGVGSDTWLLGSFGQDPALADLAFTGFAVIPEPASGATALLLTAAGLTGRHLGRAG